MVSHHFASTNTFPVPESASLPATSSTSARRASSVVSGRSSTRRHRHARTHHGGSSTIQPQNEFPVFAYTGDVEIVIATANGKKENRYLLHRLILSQCSAFFEDGMRVEWSGRAIEAPNAHHAATNGSRDGLDNTTIGSTSRASSQERRSSYDRPPRRWRYVLNWQDAGETNMPMLVQKEESTSLFGRDVSRPPAVRNKPPASNEGFFRSIANFSALKMDDRSPVVDSSEPGDEVLKDYDNLFRTMYQYAPTLDTVNIATAYTESKALLHLADMYDALDIVGSRVDHHLLRFGARLFKQIAKYPPSYLKLGYMARSNTIFTEAFIHVVGQWPHAAPQLRGQTHTAVTDLIEDKVDEMREMEERVEFRLWRLTLTSSRGDRVTPANDYLSWLAMSLFRQWFAENTTPAPTSILKESTRTQPGGAPTSATTTRPSSRSSRNSSNHVAGQRVSQSVARAPEPPPVAPPAVRAGPTQLNPGRVYRLLGSTSNATYLGHDELKRFLKSQPDLYTRDNLKRLERRMDEIKNLARDTVKPLMRNFLELDLTNFGPAGLGYLTCIKLTDRELPW